jgi:hypothetical protein
MVIDYLGLDRHQRKKLKTQDVKPGVSSALIGTWSNRHQSLGSRRRRGRDPKHPLPTSPGSTTDVSCAPLGQTIHANL